jgi:serine phosphatase RsbU (regulator of sigma subunit)
MEDRGRTTPTTKDLERSATLYKGLLEVSWFIQGLVEFAAAGHAGPWLRQVSLEIRVPAIEAAPPLGILSDLQFPVNQIKLLPGDQAIFYTDGLVESFSVAPEPFSLDRVRALLSKPYDRGSAEIVDAFTKEEANHRGEVPPHDDLTILAIGLK